MGPLETPEDRTRVARLRDRAFRLAGYQKEDNELIAYIRKHLDMLLYQQISEEVRGQVLRDLLNRISERNANRRKGAH